MHDLIRLSAIAVICGASAIVGGVAQAQQQQKQPAAKQDARPARQPAQKQAAPAPPEAPQFKEVALTDKQIEGVLDSQKELDAIAAKIPQPQGNAPPKPDPAVTAQFEDIAKKHGFASFAEYNEAVETISAVLGGFDPKTKSYVGPEAVVKQQIALVQADKSIPAKEKKAILADMNAMLKAPPPPLQNKANIELVTKYYDKLAAAMAADRQ